MIDMIEEEPTEPPESDSKDAGETIDENPTLHPSAEQKPSEQAENDTPHTPASVPNTDSPST